MMFQHQKIEWNLSRLERRLNRSQDDIATRLEYAQSCLSRAQFHDGGEVWFNRALTQARRVLQSDPGSAAALVVAGLSLVGLGRIEPASRYLDQAIRIDPERADLHFAFGALHQHAGDRHQAIRSLESACRLAPNAWEPHLALGMLLGKQAEDLNNPQRLVERSQYHVVRALQIGPSAATTPSALHYLGATCLRIGRVAEAQRLFHRLLDYPKHRSRARYFLGLCAFKLGKYKNAILFLRQHLTDGGEHPRVYARIGMCYLHLGEVSRAREACRHALALDPEDVEARWTLGCALIEEDLFDEAMRLFKAILADAPENLPSFSELVRLRCAQDSSWLIRALQAEVSGYHRLTTRRTLKPGEPPVNPRAITRQRIQILLRAFTQLSPNEGEAAIRGLLEAIDLTTDEGLRFLLWENALHLMALHRASRAAAQLQDPGKHYGSATGAVVLTLASVLPEPLLTRGLQVGEEDLRRAAVERHGPTSDVSKHRNHIDLERMEARAWQATLLLAIATRNSRSGRNLLVRWSTEADADLAQVARTALVLLGDPHAADPLREVAQQRGVAALVDTLLAEVIPPEARNQPRPVSNDEGLFCSTCGRRSDEADHLMAGKDAVICNRCVTDIAQHRRSLSVEDPTQCCSLCIQTLLDSRAVYVYRGTPVCADCVDRSLGLLEREEIDRFLASM